MPALRPVRRFQLAIRRSRPEPVSGTRCSPRSRRGSYGCLSVGEPLNLRCSAAFKKLGLDCASWTEPVYLDLLRKSAGDEEKMVNLYFNWIGWPSSLPTNEKESFVKNVLQKKKMAMDECLMSENLTLRPGVEEFVDDAYKKGIPVVVLTTYSKSGDQIARSIVEKLGEESISKLKIVGDKEVEQSLYTQLVNDTRLSSGVDEQLAKEAIKAVSSEKQRIAEEVASMLKLSVDIDTRLSESSEKIIAALRAGAEVAGLPVCDCVLIIFFSRVHVV
ncbi:CBBY-like protein [Malus sylvestris]|uniref:CBBY-like protein n=1 Tax=Malus sylvestris TaxID=3752 RepID=UPI0021ACD8DE|nr:CBBY-like protein [Malus sylvestris]